MSIAYDGLIPQGASFAHAVLTTYDPCVVVCTMPLPKLTKIERPKLSKAKGATADYRSSGVSKYDDMAMTVVFDPDEDYDAVAGNIGDQNDGAMTWTLPKKDEDNTVAATIVYASSFILAAGNPPFDYNNESSQVEHVITWAVSDYSQTDEAPA